MTLMKPIETLESCLTNIPIKTGQMIFCTDSKNIYIDNHENHRIQMTDIIKIKKESDRTSITNPLTGKIYLVEETNILYRYSGLTWEAISADIFINTNQIPYNTLVPCTLEKKNQPYAPRTLSSLVYMNDGTTIQDAIEDLKNGTIGNLSLISFKNTVIVTSDVNSVDIGYDYNKNTDILFVYINSTYIEEEEDYTILNDSIKKINGTWNGSDDRITFNFIILKSNIQEKPLISLKNTITINNSVNTVNIGIDNYDKNTDILFVYINSTYIQEGQDYTIIDNSIKKISGKWNGSIEEITFNFVVLKVTTPKKKLISHKNTTIVENNVDSVDIGIEEYNKSTDILFVYINSTYIEVSQDYIISKNKIKKMTGTWDGSEEQIVFDFIVIKMTDIQSLLLSTEYEEYVNQIATLTEKVDKYEDMISSLFEKISLLEQRLDNSSIK